MPRFAFRTAIIAAAAAVAFAAAPATAANAPTTQIVPQPGSPVEIDMCALTLPLGSQRLVTNVDIKNTSDKVVSDVEFFFVTRDVFGESRTTRGTVHGTYSPGIEIQNVYTAGLLARSAWYTNGYCTVSRVVYADGTKWSAGAGFLSSVIPGATGTPSALLLNLWPPGDE
jgi:hypothetical protein